MEADRVNILLIEDNPAEAELVRVMLSDVRGARFSIEHRDTLAAGLDLLGRGGFDVVLLDFNLPDGSGIPVFQKTYAVAPWVPILILTNVKDEATALRAVREGAQDYLLKRDVESNLLSRAIRYAIERERADRA